MKALIERKNKLGKFYMDKGELLKHKKPQTYLFLDEDTGRVLTNKENVRQHVRYVPIIGLFPTTDDDHHTSYRTCLATYT